MVLLRRILKRLFGSVILAAVTLVGAPVAFGATILAGLIFLPLPASIPLPKAVPTQQPSVIYDRFGHPIAQLAQVELDLPFTANQVPEVLKEAVISDEDRNYYHENGVDVRGLARALYADLRNRAPVQGGSTITQQYVKLAYTGSQRTIVRKIKEAILASQLAREASKNDILYHYLTLIYLGDGNTGVESASETYFHVPVQDLDVSQAATLSGLIPAPSSRAPEEHLADAEVARELVLKEMYQLHYLTEAAYAKALSERLEPASTGASPAKYTIVYPRVTTSHSQYPDFVDYVERWLQQNIPASTLEAGGLRIQTTLNPTVQNDAYAAVNATMNGSALPVDMALASVEPQTGFVDALAAGHGTSAQAAAGQYRYDNLALGGCTYPSQADHVVVSPSCENGTMIQGGVGGRQPGSSFKPFTLATAFEQGILPSTVYSSPYVYQIPGCKVFAGQPANACQIHNDEGDLGGATQETLAEATAQSTNTVYAQVAQQVGCPNVADTAKKMGIETAYYGTPPFYYCAPYALGEVGVSPLDMASAYGVFADHGQRATPTPILEIVNSQGKVLVDNIHPLPKTDAALSSTVADNVTNVLQGVISSGTGTAANIGRPAAGKTGTTTNNTDAWFVGYTPTLSTAVWMGDVNSDTVPVGSSPACPKGCVTGHYTNGYQTTFYGVYGGEWPAITWKEFMQAALVGVPATPFSQPAPLVTPQEAAALQARQTTTTQVVQPGSPSAPQPIPSGGPYVYPAKPPVAAPPTTVPPPTTTTTTLPSGATTTTIPDTTTTTNPLGFNRG